LASWSDILIAIISVLGGGFGLKILENFLNRSKAKAEQAKLLRDELKSEAGQLRIEIDALKKEIKEQELELESWKEKYWSLYREYNFFQISVQRVLASHNIDPIPILMTQETKFYNNPQS